MAIENTDNKISHLENIVGVLGGLIFISIVVSEIIGGVAKYYLDCFCSGIVKL